MIAMVCAKCARPWARTPAAVTACPFCGADQAVAQPARLRTARRRLPVLTFPWKPGQGTPFEQALVRQPKERAEEAVA